MESLPKQLPAEFKLLDSERLVPERTVKHPLRSFEKTPSSIEQILRLTGSSSLRSLGVSGPSVAALSMEPRQSGPKMMNPFREKNGSDTPDHLRLYEVLFGRDSLRVAIDLISNYPKLARATILRLAELQGIGHDDSREEEPGKIIHEARDEDDPRAIELSQELGWGWPYYGSVDATPEFVRTLHAYFSRTEDNYRILSSQYIDRSGTKRDIAYALDMALEWITTRLDSNPEGLLEYKSTIPKGIENQVWKDSPDAYHHSDGTIANHEAGIASVEVQVTTYDALIDAAEIYERTYGDMEKSSLFKKRAQELKETILNHFWTDDKGGYFVLGTDRDEKNKLRQMKVRTSNMGHVLNSRLLEGDDPELIEKRQAVVRQILSPSMLNISGIRTLANDEVRFRAGAYHNGSVWLWDTHHIAKGLRRHGYHPQANELDRRLLHVVETTKVFPEYVRGDDDLLPSVNEWTITVWDEALQREMKIEQPPQEVQAWTVAAILATKRRLDRDRRKSEKVINSFASALQQLADRTKSLSDQTLQVSEQLLLKPIRPKHKTK